MSPIHETDRRRADKRLGGTALIAAFLLAAAGGVAAAPLDPRNLVIDQAMGVLRTDPVLTRLLTERPRLQPELRGEQPFKQQPPDAQTDFRPVTPGAGDRGGGGPPCWVARAVYGADDPRWRLFRAWLLHEAPAWFRGLYIRHGEAFAVWLDDKPAVKAVIRRWMDARLRGVVERRVGAPAVGMSLQ